MFAKWSILLHQQKLQSVTSCHNTYKVLNKQLWYMEHYLRHI